MSFEVHRFSKASGRRQKEKIYDDGIERERYWQLDEISLLLILKRVNIHNNFALLVSCSKTSGSDTTKSNIAQQKMLKLGE